MATTTQPLEVRAQLRDEVCAVMVPVVVLTIGDGREIGRAGGNVAALIVDGRSPARRGSTGGITAEWERIAPGMPSLTAADRRASSRTAPDRGSLGAGSTSPPALDSRSRISVVASAFCTSVCSRATMGAGVFAGTNTPAQEVSS